MFRALIIGAGAISDSHIEGYKTLDERVRIVGIADIDVARAQRKIGQYGLNARAYADYREALNDLEIDLVSICTPPVAHAPASIDCLDSGANVIVEKPMATSLTECDRMMAAAARNGKILSPVAQTRFREAPHKIKKLLEMNMTGRLLHVQTNAFFWRGRSYYDLDWRGLWEKEGGGCTLNHAVHYIDLMLWMAGKPCEVSAFMTNQYHENSEVEDLSAAILRYPDGALGQITSSLIHHGEKPAMYFQTERAGLGLPFSVNCSKSLENGFPESDPELEKKIAELFESIPGPEYSGHTGQIDNVLRAMETGSGLGISAQDGRNTLELITAIYKSAMLNSSVRLPLGREDEFCTTEGILKWAPRYFRKTKSIAGFTVNTITVGSEDLDGRVPKG